jgi:uncharacterized membrane protein YjfL (UPF0719 family)
MRLDAAIQRLDSLTSTQLYALIVGLTVLISFVVLGSAADSVDVEQRQPVEEKRPRKASNKTGGHPEPRWHIFRWVNVAVAVVFSGSVADFFLHASQYITDSDVLLKYLGLWCLLLLYFFGFFGISFVHDDMSEQEEEEQQQTGYVRFTGLRPRNAPQEKLRRKDQTAVCIC